MLATGRTKGEGNAALAFAFSGAFAALIVLPVTQLLDLKRAAGMVAVGLLLLGLAQRVWTGQPLQQMTDRLRLALAGAVLGWLLIAAAAPLRAGLQLRGQLLVAGVLLAWGMASLPRTWSQRLVLHWRRAALLVAMWALLQRAGVEWIPAYAAAGSKLRAMGSYGNAGYLAAFLCLSWPLALEWHGRRRQGALALFFAALLATQSRAGLAAVTVQAAWLGWQAYREGLRPSRSLGLALLAAAVLAIAFYPPAAWFRPTLRPQLWRAAIDLWLAHPLSGWGPGSFALAVQDHLGPAAQSAMAATQQFAEDPHQVFLGVLAESGLLGLAVFVGLLATAWRLGRDQGEPASRWLLLGGLGLLVESCADRFFFQPGVFLLACAGLGMLGWRKAQAPLRSRWQAPLLVLAAGLFFVTAAQPLLAYRQAVGAADGVPAIAPATGEAPLRAQLALDPQDALAHEQLGALLASRQDYAQAADEDAAALALAPRSALAQNLGNCYFMLGRWPDAERAFRQAVRLDPASADAQFSLGYALFHERRLKEATDALDAALRLDPGHAGARKLKEQILQ